MAAPPLAAVLKRQEEAAPELCTLVETWANDDFDQLLIKLRDWSALPWTRPRGDLCHWLPLLKRLDGELSNIVSQYDFGASVPLVLSTEHESTIQVIVHFSATLTENCANRVVYPSMPILKLLIETANIAIVSSTLMLLTKFLPRKGSNFAATSLLAQHVSERTIIRLCTIVPTQIGSQHCELQDFYELQFADPSAELAAVNSADLGWDVSPSYLRSTDLGQIFRDAAANLSPQLIPGLRYRVWLARAYAGDADGRRHMVFAQCHAAACCIYILQSAKFTSTVLSTAPSTIHSIAKLVNPDDDRPAIPELRLLGVQTLQHICFDYESIGMTVLRRCNNLGVMSLLPKITRAARAGEPIDEAFVARLFGLLRYTSTGNLVSIGLISLALEFIAVDSLNYLKSRTACVSFLNSLVMEVPAANNAFIEANGVEILLEILGREVDLDRVDKLDEKAPDFCITDHTMSLDRVRWVCSSVVLLANLLTLRRSSALLRKLLDSKLLDICQSLIANPSIFSGRNAALALDLVVALMKQDENTFQVLQERELLLPMLKNTASLFDPKFRQYPAGIAFYVAMSSVGHAIPDYQPFFFNALSRAFDVISEDLLQIPMFTFRQIGRAAFANLGGSPGERQELLTRLLDLYSLVKQKLSKELVTNSNLSVISVDSEGTEWFPAPPTAYALDALVHLSETSLEEPSVMAAFLTSNGHIKLLESLTESPLPYNFSDRVVGKTRLYRLFRRMHQMSSSRKTFSMQFLLFLKKVAESLIKKIRSSSGPVCGNSNEHIELLWAMSSFCFAIQAVSRILFDNVRYAATVVHFFNSATGVPMYAIMDALGEIHRWALQMSAKWITDLDEQLEWATNPISARVFSDMGPGVGLSSETTAAATDYVKKLFDELPASRRNDAQLIRAQRWLFARTHLLCTEFMGNVAMYATADEIYEQDPKTALLAAEKISSIYLEGLRSAVHGHEIGIEERHSLLFMLVDLRTILINDHKLPNIGAYVMFVQSSGLRELMVAVKRLAQSKRGSTTTSLYLAPKCTGSDLYDETIIYALDRLSELVASPATMSESLFNSEFCVRSSEADEPEYFSMAQFYVELRINVLLDIRNELPLEIWRLLPPLALEPMQRIFESAFTEVPADSDEMALPMSDLERERLPLLLLPQHMIDWQDKIAALTSTGSISPEDASAALKEHEGSVRLVCQAMNLPLPPESLFEREQVVGQARGIGQKIFKVIDDLYDLRDLWRDWIGEYLLAVVDHNDATTFYAAAILSQLTWSWEEVEKCTLAEMFHRLLSELNREDISTPRLHFLAVLSGYSWIAHEIRPHLVDTLDQLANLVVGPDAAKVPFAATLMEKAIMEDGSLSDAVAKWSDASAPLFVEAFAGLTRLTDDVANITVARMLLNMYWQTSSYALSLSLVDSGIIKHFMETIQRLEGNISGQQLQTATILLMRSVVEPPDVQSRVMESTLVKELMQEFPRAEIEVTVENLAEVFVRNPQLMFEICTRDTFYDERNEVLHPRAVYEMYADHLNEYILKQKYQVPRVPSPPKPYRGPTARQMPSLQIGQLVHLVVSELLKQPYEQVFADAKKYVGEMSDGEADAKFDLAHPTWVEFRKVTNYMNFLLVTLYELCDVSEIARQAMLFYPEELSSIPSDLAAVPDTLTPILPFLLQVICAYDSERTLGLNSCYSVAESLALIAGQIIYGLTFMAAESFVDTMTVRNRKSKTTYLCLVCEALLEHHFGFAKKFPDQFSDLFPSWSCSSRVYRLLGTIVSLMTLVLRQNALEWQSAEPTPFIALAVLGSNLPDLIARCLSRADISDPVIAEAREKIYAFFTAVSFYDSLDVESKFPVPVGEPVITLESRSHEPSIIDLFSGEGSSGSRSLRRNIIRDLSPMDVYETFREYRDTDIFGTNAGGDSNNRRHVRHHSALRDQMSDESESGFPFEAGVDRQVRRRLLLSGDHSSDHDGDTQSPGVDLGDESLREDHMFTEDEDSNRTDPLFSNPELESWASDIDRAEDDGYLSYENVSDEDAASLGSDHTHDSLDGESELEHGGAGDEEMFSDDELGSQEDGEMDIELVLEAVSDLDSNSDASSGDFEESDELTDYISDEASDDEVEPRGRSASETSGAVFDGDSLPNLPSRASMLAQLYAQDVDDYDSTEDESDASNGSLDGAFDEDVLNFNPFDIETGPRPSAHVHPLTQIGGLTALSTEFTTVSEPERAFCTHPNTRENYLDMVVYKMDDGGAYQFTYDDIDLDSMILRNPVHTEPHLLARATDFVVGGEAPSVCKNVSPLQAGQILSGSPITTAFMEFSNRRTLQRWETYAEFVGLPKRTTFVRKALNVLLQTASQRFETNNAWLDTLYRTADSVWEIETHNPPAHTFFDMTNNELNLEDETERFITSDDVVWHHQPVIAPRASISRPWDHFSQKYSSATVWSSSLPAVVVYSQLRLIFAPWPTPNDVELMCKEISAMPWDLFHLFIQELCMILVNISDPNGGLKKAYFALAPDNSDPNALALSLKSLESTSSERVLHQAMFLLIALHETAKFRTLLANVDPHVKWNGHTTINLLLRLVDQNIFLSDSVLLERLLLLIHHIVRFVVKKLKQSDNLGVSELVSHTNLQRLMRVWTAHECTSNAFRYAVESVRLLSQFSDINNWVNHQLVLNISEWISLMIDELEGLRESSEPEERLIARLTSYTSVQAMLLRLLTVVRFNSQLDTNDIVVELLRQQAFEPLIQKLDQVLATHVSKSDQFTRIASLRPLIESLILVGKVTSTGKFDRQRCESFRKSIFGFIEHHSALFNQLVYKNSTQLLNDSVSMLEDSMQLLTFENRKLYFANRMIMVRQLSQRRTVPLNVPRVHMFERSMKYLMGLQPEDFRAAHIEVHFDGEEGIDQGGLNREWYSEMTKAIFHPESGLFEQLGSGLHPKFSVAKNVDRFLFIGRLIGKAMFDGQLLDVGFSLPVYKYLLGEKITFEDLKIVDEEYYNSLKWMLENDITDVIDEVFAMQVPEQPDTQFNLIPNGANIQVTESNKAEYVQLRALWKLLNSAKPQLRALKKGFYEIMDAAMVKLFNPKELELVISGIPKIDITDWRLNTEYDGYSAASSQIRWFWRAVKSFDHSQRAMLLQFCTGSAKVPIDGFEHLPAGKFNISRDRQSPDRLPTAHTCTNHLCLPEYPSYDVLRGAVMRAVLDGAGSFGLA